ncbi:GreA/GreB family elongation factor [Rheinheimera maricola]|uniref:GreA/GreB family elongation factor n=1 Tax=Rheinheimera maricola TaxID=2793282 RepID=A0ABS7X9V7_9GAMM|nr:GreA/GreB family elongation factor [Rheinheimera maricola]MBZ9611865.1 GreA/GreB family elongation factor [Rheinheimera maricola]
MYFCYPKQSNKIVACTIAQLACRQFFPLTALQLNHMLHAIADSKNQSRLRSNGGIRPGSTVELQNIDTGEQGWLQLVNPAQANYHQGRISLLSPLGCALPGKTVDMVISLQLLGYTLRLRILSVLYVKHNVQHDTLTSLN